MKEYKKSKCENFSEAEEIQLFSLFKELNYELGATYMSYTFDVNDKQRYSFRTDSNWASLYSQEKVNGRTLIEICPLDVVSREECNKIILWDSFRHPCQPETSRNIMGMRADLGLEHGITLSTYFKGNHDALALATEDKKNNLGARCLEKEKLEQIKKALVNCRNLITRVNNKNDH